MRKIRREKRIFDAKTHCNKFRELARSNATQCNAEIFTSKQDRNTQKKLVNIEWKILV